MYCDSIETTPVHGIRSQCCPSCCQYWALYEWCNVQCLIKAFSFQGILFCTIGLFQSVHFLICTYLKRTAQTETRTEGEKKRHHGNWKMIEKGNCWCKNASSLLNCEIGSHGVNTCHSLEKSWMHVNHIWHFCVGRFKPQIDIMLLVNTYVLMMRMVAGTGQGGRSFAKVWRAFAKKFGLGRKS